MASYIRNEQAIYEHWVRDTYGANYHPQHVAYLQEMFPGTTWKDIAKERRGFEKRVVCESQDDVFIDARCVSYGTLYLIVCLCACICIYTSTHNPPRKAPLKAILNPFSIQKKGFRSRSLLFAN